MVPGVYVGLVVERQIPNREVCGSIHHFCIIGWFPADKKINIGNTGNQNLPDLIGNTGNQNPPDL